MITKKNILKLDLYDKTFILSHNKDPNYFNYNYLSDYLLSNNLKKNNNPNSKPQLLYLNALENGRLDKKYYNTRAYLMNIISKKKSIITDKFLLYDNFKKKFPDVCYKYMAKTWPLRNFNNKLLNGKNVFIVRPIGEGAYKGRGISVIISKEELIKQYEKLKQYENVIVSQYIISPMLYNGKKFHLRTYLLASNINGIFKTWFYEFYEIFTAEKPYIKNDWDNKEIHDTHLKSSGTYILAPYDLKPKMKKIFKEIIFPQMLDCMKYVSKLLDGHAIPYPNSKNCFEVFGCDIMVKDNYEIVLLEINEKIGLNMSDFPNRLNQFSNLFCGKINNLILGPALFNKEPTELPLYSRIIE